MANSTEYENSTSATEVTSWNAYSTSMAILAGINIFLAITASLGNTLILIALHKVTSIYPPTKLLFRCLAVTDLLVGLISQPLYVTILFPRFTTWNVNVDIPFADGFFFRLLSVVSLLTSAAISVDRLLALLLGLRYRYTVTLRRVWVVIVCFWVISALSATGSVFFEYPKLAEIARYIARYKKTVYSIAWVQLALLICYFLYNLIGFLKLFRKLPFSNEIYIEFPWESFVSLLYLNSSLNPALYCSRIRDVRQEVKNMIRKILRCF